MEIIGMLCGRKTTEFLGKEQNKTTTKKQPNKKKPPKAPLPFKQVT